MNADGGGCTRKGSFSTDEPISRVRAFNRFYTKQIGVLNEGLAHTPFSLTEARVIYELAHHGEGVTATALGAELGLDAGYLSRILMRFKERGLIERKAAPDDRRQRLLRLTKRGRETFATLDAGSRAEIADLLSPLTPAAQQRLLGAMHDIETLLGAGRTAMALPDGSTATGVMPADGPATVMPDNAVTSARRADAARTDIPGFVLRGPRPGDMGWVTCRHGALYYEEYGWDWRFEALVARIVADFVDHFDPARERCWIAERHGEIAGSIFLVRESERVAKLRLLLVEPSARGFGLGRLLVDECISHARVVGYERMVLWTNSVLTAARRIYERTGFRLVREEPHTSYGPELVGQYWEKTL